MNVYQCFVCYISIYQCISVFEHYCISMSMYSCMSNLGIFGQEEELNKKNNV